MILTKTLLPLVFFLLLSVSNALGFTTNNTSISISFDKETASLQDIITVIVSFVNQEAVALRGFYYAEQIPQCLSVKTISVMVNDNPIDYLFESGSVGEVYPGNVDYRWILETPAAFAENNPIPRSSGLRIVYSITSSQTGTFHLDEFDWVGYYEGGIEAAFGHSEEADKKTISFIETLKPVVEFSAASLNGSEATTPASITVTLSAASGQTVTVNYATGNGTATAGSDYTATSGTLTFSPGVTNQTISVPIINDTTVEGNQTFMVTLSGPVNATLGVTATHTYTIYDNDTPEAIYPSEGTYGTELVIAGSDFGLKKGKVFIGSTGLEVLEWADDLISCRLAKIITPGIYDVVVQPVGPKGTPPVVYQEAFNVRSAEIYSIEQGEGSAYDQVHITGKFFGTKKGAVYLEYGKGETLIRKNCKISNWTMDPTTGDSEIVFVVPKMLPKVCDVVVDPYGIIPDDEDEEEDGFTVKAPEIVSITPNSGSVSNQITISGNFFGSEKPKVYLGYVSKGKPTKKSCSVVSWNDDEIFFTVPKLPLGTYDVIVTNSVSSDTLPGGFIVK